MPKFTEFKPEEDDVDEYLERFEIFLRVNAVKTEDKAVTLLNYIGKASYQVLKTLLVPDSPVSKSYDVLSEVLKRHYAPKRLVIAERTKFHWRNQEVGESLADFSLAIKKLAQTCVFKDYLDQALRDRLVAGCRDPEVQRTLIQLDDDYFDEVLKVGLAKELSLRKTDEIRQPGVPDSMDVHRVQAASRRLTIRKVYHDISDDKDEPRMGEGDYQAPTEEDVPSTKPPEDMVTEKKSGSRRRPEPLPRAKNVPVDVASLPTVSIGTDPLVCVTGTHSRLPLLPQDGVCDFAIFSDVVFGDGEWVSSNSRGKLDRFMEMAKKSGATVFMLSFPAKMQREMGQFLSSTAAADLIRDYATKGIRGYGFARVDVTVRERDFASDYAGALELLNIAMKSAVPMSGVSFIGMLLRPSSAGKSSDLHLSTAIIRNVDMFIVISHTLIPDSSECKVKPISSWTSEHLNDDTLLPLSAALNVIKKEKDENTTFALSFSLGVLEFQVAESSLGGIDGVWNIACSHCLLESYELVCRDPLTRGRVGTDDLITYDFSKKRRRWRSYETAESIRKKVRRM
ncbi:uncharacterized protein LOC115325764 [Ixodes scapularis]|uniref:uncharacterized protein LOC115325764 n=1 Tax=Ixodes scapularis TaxID=6945 RepID=UPI001C3820C4|nr:uncharacterized protein LOC115325764 [Ixodes scapularis]